MFLKQMQVGNMAVFAYLLGDTSTGEALVIDPAANIDGIIAQADQKLKSSILSIPTAMWIISRAIWT
jgi:hypothetical protein